MPFTIDEDRFDKQETLDMSKPQGTTHGLPVKHIPYLEYPKAIYQHPVEPFFEVLHRNVNHEVVHRELVPSEHRVHICADEREFKAKLKEGWVVEPYIPQAAPDPMEHLYRRAEK